MRRQTITICILLLWLASACAGKIPPTSTPEPQDTPTRIILALTPTYTHTPSPSLTLTPTPLPHMEPLAGIKFQTNDGLFVTDGLGNNRLIFSLKEEQSAYPSPDGRYVLFFSWFDNEIIVDQNNNQTKIWPRDDYNLCPFFWIPGHPAYLMGTLLDADSSPGYSCERGSPVLLSPDGNLTFLDKEGSGWSRPKASPDGQFIAYDLAGIPWLFDWQQGPRLFDVGDYGFASQEDVHFAAPSWSPDGTNLSWIYWSTAHDQTTGKPLQQGIAIFNLFTKKVTQLSPYNVPEYEGGWPRVIWNNDGTFIALWHYTDTEPYFVWHIIATDGSYSRLLNGEFSKWNPDGTLFTLFKYQEQRKSCIFSWNPRMEQ